MRAVATLGRLVGNIGSFRSITLCNWLKCLTELGSIFLASPKDVHPT